MEVNMEVDSTKDSNSWIPTSFSKPAEDTGEINNSCQSDPMPGTSSTSNVDPEPIEPSSDDLSFDAISRQKLEMVEIMSPKCQIPGMSMYEEDTRSSWSSEPPKQTAEVDAQLKESTQDEDSQNSTCQKEFENTVSTEFEESKEIAMIEEYSQNSTNQILPEKSPFSDHEKPENIAMIEDSQNSMNNENDEKRIPSFSEEEPKKSDTPEEDIQNNANQEIVEETVACLSDEQPKEVTELNESSQYVGNENSFDSPGQDEEESKETPMLTEVNTSKNVIETSATLNDAELKETMVFDEDSQKSQNPKEPEKPPSAENETLEEIMQSNEDSQNSTSQKMPEKAECLDQDIKEVTSFPPEKLCEYMWPQENGDFFLLQEQICDYLNVKSFKRKYPDLVRRTVEKNEKKFLRERGVVTEMQCDLGLTALRSEEVLELMSKDYPDQYSVYIRVLREKEQQKNREAAAANHSEKVKMVDLVKKAMKSAAEYNAHLNQERREERKSCMDLQTFTVHYPAKTVKVKTDTKPGKYPVALLPGQFQDYYKEFSSDELKYLPINTVLYGPLRELQTVTASQSDGSQSDSDDSTASDGSGSSTHDDSSSESEKNGETTQEQKNSTDPLLKSKVLSICLKRL